MDLLGIQLISLVSGVIYMIMQVVQHRWMWYLNLLTCTSALIVSAANFNDGVWGPLWAQVILNAYFIVMSVVGIVNWKKLEHKSGGQLHLVKLTRRESVTAIAAGLVGTPAICLLFSLTNDPSPIADGLSFSFSILAAWMLSYSHIENWHLWIAADIVTVYLFASQGDWWMSLLYACYVVSAVIGLVHWRRSGIYV
ncbi:MAG: nicotinamide riboside transporter PnuC [Bacteroidales bacterium]|nr:nicotinamide riboside transporter PnuC [Bacteroidales bacterium]